MAYQPATAAPMPSRPPGVTGAAIALILSGAASFVSAAIWMAAGLSVVHDDVQQQVGFGGSDIFAYVVLFSPVLSVFLSPATIIGGVQMLRRRNRRLTTVGAVLAIVPLTGCCLLAGIPCGIYALFVLRRAETMAWYRSGAAPPPPDPYGQYGAGQYGPWR
ncbi:hypothetical protein [Actinocatenispora thailandica]|nr:hypothetical protein [Actinocatenispora thailandica]